MQAQVLGAELPGISFFVEWWVLCRLCQHYGYDGFTSDASHNWDNLVSWVGTHVEKLADWSCDQVRADIEKRGDKTQWTAAFDGFYLTRGH